MSEEKNIYYFDPKEPVNYDHDPIAKTLHTRRLDVLNNLKQLSIKVAELAQKETELNKEIEDHRSSYGELVKELTTICGFLENRKNLMGVDK